jgi:hypothetical protein
MESGHWTWLEVAKLAAGLLTPATLAVVGIYVHRITKRFEHVQWKNQKLTEKRLAIYDDLGPLFNDLLCYFCYVGGWRDWDPPAVVALKRTIDKKIHHAAPLFSAEFFAACTTFQGLCFETYQKWGKDASLRTKFGQRKAHRKDWNKNWERLFSKQVTHPQHVRAAYDRVMKCFAEEIGVYSNSVPPPTDRKQHHADPAEQAMS